jgi:hypothetical protein
MRQGFEIDWCGGGAVTVPESDKSGEDDAARLDGSGGTVDECFVELVVRNSLYNGGRESESRTEDI